jgi:serine O-acetyltransferase
MFQPSHPFTISRAAVIEPQRTQTAVPCCPLSTAQASPDQHTDSLPATELLKKLPLLQTICNSLQESALLTDFRSIFERDPAARNWLEVLVCYPGLHALACHRLAHWLRRCGVPFFPRFISHIARFLTGIEIHPGATIGKGVVIDHGMGVVIGETAILGDYCLIYQGVTLGGTGKETGKRHPTLGSHVVVGAGAKVLGNIHIGDRARVGAGSIVLRNVPAGCTAVGVPGRNICRQQHSPNCPLDHDKLPDAEATVIRALVDRIERLEQELQTLKSTRSYEDVHVC